jgi:dTDP-4-dehydrorhamnose reductase
MLGTELVGLLRAGDRPVIALGRAELDIGDRDAVYAALGRHRPATVVNCAAWTAVDAAETHEADALAVNGTAVGVLARACVEHGATLIQPSTDYVFAGSGSVPYPEDAPTDPINAYGRTKLAGEEAVLASGHGHVVRTAWLYGAHGASFVRTMIRLAGEHDTVSVVADQHGQPTWTGDLAVRIVELADSDAAAGIYHGTNSGTATWYDLAREVFTLLGLDPERVHPTTTEAYPRPAPRPAWSVLGHDRWSAAAGLPPMRDWRTALHAAWPELPH